MDDRPHEHARARGPDRRRQGQPLLAARNATGDCPVVRVPASGGDAETVGTIPAPCSPAGLAFDRRGDLYVTNAPRSYRLRPSASNPPVATVFATGVRAPTASRSTSAARSGCPTAARVKVASGGSGAAAAHRRRCSACSRWSTRARRRRPRSALGAAGDRDDHAGRSASNTLARSTRRQRPRLRPRRLAVHRRHRARRDLARRARAARAGAQRGRLRHHVRVEHAVPEQRVRAAPGARGRRRHRARPRGQRDHGGQRAQRHRGGDAALRRRRAVPQPGEPGGAAQRGPARVPDEPGDRRQEAVPRELGRVAARQLPQHRRRGRRRTAGRGEALLPRTGCRSKGCRCRCASRSPWAGRAAPRVRARARPGRGSCARSRAAGGRRGRTSRRRRPRGRARRAARRSPRRGRRA